MNPNMLAIVGNTKKDSTPKFATGGTVEQTGMAEVHAGETIIPARGSNNFLELVGKIGEMGGDNKKLDQLISVSEKNARINEHNRSVSFDKWKFQTVSTDYTGFR